MTRKAGNLLPFNRQAIEKAGPINDKATEYRVEGVRGLVLRVQPSGEGSYYFYYHVRHGNVRKLRKLKLANRKDTSHHTIRRQVEELRHEVADGADPAGEGASKRAAVTVRELAQQRFEKDIDLAESTRRVYRHALEKDVLSSVGDYPAMDVTPEMVIDILDRIEARGSRRQADHTRSAIGSTFKWGLKRKLVKQDPTQGLGKRATSVARTRLLTDDELRTFWKATEDEGNQLSRSMRLILQLAVLTGQRRTQVAGARISELRLDGPNPIWTIPGDTNIRGKVVKGRSKNRKEQIVPLSTRAVACFKRAIALAAGSQFVFPADLTKVKLGKQPRTGHINGESVTHAVTRLREQLGLQDVTVHDLRRTLSTWLGDQGVRPDVIEAILSHKPRDVTRRHYNHSTLSPLVRSALQAWANHVEAVVSGNSERSKVVQLTTAAG